MAATEVAAEMAVVAAARLVLEMAAFRSPTGGSNPHLNEQPQEE